MPLFCAKAPAKPLTGLCNNARLMLLGAVEKPRKPAIASFDGSTAARVADTVRCAVRRAPRRSRAMDRDLDAICCLCDLEIAEKENAFVGYKAPSNSDCDRAHLSLYLVVMSPTPMTMCCGASEINYRRRHFYACPHVRQQFTSPPALVTVHCRAGGNTLSSSANGAIQESSVVANKQSLQPQSWHHSSNTRSRG